MLSEILDEGVQRGLRGENITVTLTSNPNAIKPTKLGITVPAGKGIYTAIVGEESSGKTAFADQFYVLNQFLHARKHGGNIPYTIYRSFERPKLFKLAKWLAYIIFYESGGRLEYSTEQILSWANNPKPLHDGDLRVVRDHYPILDDLSKHIELLPGLATPEEVQEHALKIAYQKGKVVEAKRGKLIVNGKVEGDLSLSETTDGITRLYFEGKRGRVYEGETRYFPDDHTHVVTHLVDHISRYAEDKGVIDSHTQWASGTARDIFGWQVVDLNQLNRLNITNERGYYALQNVKNSGTLTADADVVLAVADPASLRLPMWAKYDIQETVFNGENLFRGVQILKNTYGIRPMMGMAFTGAVGHYGELPAADEMQDRDYHILRMKQKPIFV
jgi:hypothetical protein